MKKKLFIVAASICLIMASCNITSEKFEISRVTEKDGFAVAKYSEYTFTECDQAMIKIVDEVGLEHDFRVVGDPTRVRQILSNLIGNAIKFTDKGEVTIRVYLQDEHVRFDIKDTGIGISAEQIPHVFAPFHQAESSISRRFGGTGLGIAICKQLVEKMHGEIWLDSEIGKGSEFHFTLRLPAVA